MHVEWYGQSAFRLRDGERTVFLDPFGDMSAARERGMRWEYPPVAGVAADLLLVTHEHGDHNGVGAIDGAPALVRSAAGRHQTPLGEVLGVASEHDEAAGTERGANVMYRFAFGGLTVAHLGDLGQRALREEQRAALGSVDLLFVPVGDGPTIGAEQAAEVAAQLGAAIVVPMHHRTERIDFLEPVDPFLARFDRVQRPAGSSFDTDALPGGAGALVVAPAAP